MRTLFQILGFPLRLAVILPWGLGALVAVLCFPNLAEAGWFEDLWNFALGR